MKNNMTISGFIASNTSLNLDNLDTGVRVAPEIASRIRATGARTSVGRVSSGHTSDACATSAYVTPEPSLCKEKESRE